MIFSKVSIRQIKNFPSCTVWIIDLTASFLQGKNSKIAPMPTAQSEGSKPQPITGDIERWLC